MGLKNRKEFASEQVNTFFRHVQRNQLANIKQDLVTIKESKDNFNTVVNSLILDKSGDTALHVCARNGYLDLTRYLVEEEGANLEQQNLDGKTALHDAAQFSQLEIVEYLLIKGANVNVVKRADWTPLMLACTKQDIHIIKALINAGANLGFTNKDGWTCIHLAAREGNLQIFSYLLEACGSLRKTLLQKKSRNGRKPIHTAVMHGHIDLLKVIARESSPQELNEEDNCGTTPLMEACRFGFIDMAKFFLCMDEISPNIPNKNGVSLLHVAAEANQADVIDFLVRYNQMDINIPSSFLSMMPLHWAAKEGSLTAVKKLIQLGADPHSVDSKLRTAADIAREFNKSDVQEFLINIPPKSGPNA